ncbi:hypothetical protein L596_025729 [Steinernema carpocapsae]|uniref:Uncharacterized protein n=1 Tax=Steinernema carpocapsae TaxID=34508 RepID=A0A4U5M8N5_STECR|nr:hypothetical protein L596_025729 [Steinernema carpocapsae]
MKLFLAFLGLIALCSSKECCSACERKIISLNDQLENCLTELNQKKLKLQMNEACGNVTTENTCSERLLEMSKTLGECLKSLCAGKTDIQTVNVTIKIAPCPGDIISDLFSIALAKQVEVRGHDIAEATHAIFNYPGHEYKSSIYPSEISAVWDNASLIFKQSYSTESCCSETYRWNWISTHYYGDPACNAYMGSTGAIGFFGRQGMTNILNDGDFAKMQAGTLAAMHGLCKACG